MQTPTQHSIAKTLGVGVFLLVLVGLGYLGLQVWQWLSDEQKLPVQHIAIQGERRYLQDEDLQARIRQGLPGSFVEIDIDAAHQLIEADPWVFQASVRKEWPNTLQVYLVEQVPVARWNDDLLLNQHGDSFQVPIAGDLENLPMLFGPGGSETTAVQGYRAMHQLLAVHGLRIDELYLSERFAWHLQLDNGIALKLGRSEFIDRVQRFVDLYPLLKADDRAVEYVDLRYDTGLAVGWQQQSKEQKLVRERQNV